VVSKKQRNKNTERGEQARREERRRREEEESKPPIPCPGEDAWAVACSGTHTQKGPCSIVGYPLAENSESFLSTRTASSSCPGSPNCGP
jgi:hypothetical protein